MSTELGPLDDSHVDLSTLPREEVERRAGRAMFWFETAQDIDGIKNELAADLEIALNACQQYQRAMALEENPDPQHVAVRRLLTKYKMTHEPAAKTARVFVNGVDITEHPDSVPGTVEDVIELTAEEYYGIETVELVQLEDGSMHFLAPPAPESDITLDDADVAAIHEELQG